MTNNQSEAIRIIGYDYMSFDKVKIGEADGHDLSKNKRLEEDIDITAILDSLFKEIEKDKEKLIINFSTRSNRRSSDKKNLCKVYNGINMIGGIVGILRRKIKYNTKLYDITLEIHSRFDTDDKHPYFLATMLMQETGLNFNPDTVPVDSEAFFDFLLLALFKRHLLDAQRKGYYREYRRFERNDDRLRGSIDVARHIRLNMGQDNGRIAYSYRENTVNNFLNHLIVAAYECLKKKYPGMVSSAFDSNRDIKGTIDFLRNEIGYSKANSYVLINKNMRPISHPYFTEYEQLRQTCIKILRNEKLSCFNGKEGETDGILFYMPDLWEDFLEKKLMTGLGDGIRVEAQNEIKVFGIKNKENERDSFKQPTRPDFVFYNDNKDNDNKDNEPFMILDAKFKPGWANAAIKGQLGEALLPDYDKCLRDMVDINAHATGVIFPVSAEEEEKAEDGTETNATAEQKIIIPGPVLKHPDCFREHAISEHNKTDKFYTIPIKVPSLNGGETEKGYQEWEIKLDKWINNEKDYLNEIIKERANFNQK